MSTPKTEAGNVGHEAVLTVLEDTGLYVPALLEAELYEGCRTLLPYDDAVGVAESASAYTDYVIGLPGEKHHEIKAVHPTIPDFFGTIDTLVIHEGNITIVDLKTGTYKVPAKGNTQLQCHALLAREHLGIKDDVTGVIVQSRVYKRPQKAVFSTAQLDRFEDEVQQAGESDELYAGSHCKFCPLKSGCSAYARRYGD